MWHFKILFTLRSTQTGGFLNNEQRLPIILCSVFLSYPPTILTEAKHLTSDLCFDALLDSLDFIIQYVNNAYQKQLFKCIDELTSSPIFSLCYGVIVSKLSTPETRHVNIVTFHVLCIILSIKCVFLYIMIKNISRKNKANSTSTEFTFAAEP